MEWWSNGALKTGVMICCPIIRVSTTPLLQHSIHLMPTLLAPPNPATPVSPYTRANPFPGKLVVNRRLSGPESEKDTRHFEVDLTGWGLSFEVGDSMAVYPTNDPELVDAVIHLLGAKGDEPVPVAKTQTRVARSAAAKLFHYPAHAEVIESDRLSALPRPPCSETCSLRIANRISIPTFGAWK